MTTNRRIPDISGNTGTPASRQINGAGEVDVYTMGTHETVTSSGFGGSDYTTVN